jgi:hypothetical protein
VYKGEDQLTAGIVVGLKATQLKISRQSIDMRRQIWGRMQEQETRQGSSR